MACKHVLWVCVCACARVCVCVCACVRLCAVRAWRVRARVFVCVRVCAGVFAYAYEYMLYGAVRRYAEPFFAVTGGSAHLSGGTFLSGCLMCLPGHGLGPMSQPL